MVDFSTLYNLSCGLMLMPLSMTAWSTYSGTAPATTKGVIPAMTFAMCLKRAEKEKIEIRDVYNEQ